MIHMKHTHSAEAYVCVSIGSLQQLNNMPECRVLALKLRDSSKIQKDLTLNPV